MYSQSSNPATGVDGPPPTEPTPTVQPSPVLTPETFNDQLPAWKTRPCPSWCEGLHNSHDSHPDDGVHYGPDLRIFLTTAAPVIVTTPKATTAEPVELAAYLIQHDREFEPRVEVAIDKPEGGTLSVPLTLAEARAVAEQLLSALSSADVEAPR